jgi:excisionase family DNA binding protein
VHQTAVAAPFDRLLSIKEAAELLGCALINGKAPNFLYDAARSGELRCYLPGREYRFAREDLLEWAHRRAQEKKGVPLWRP